MSIKALARNKNKKAQSHRKSLQLSKFSFNFVKHLKKRFKTSFIIKIFRSTQDNFVKELVMNRASSKGVINRYKRNKIFWRVLPLMYLFNKYKTANVVCDQLAKEFEMRTKHWPIIKSYRDFFEKLGPKDLYGWKVTFRGKVNGVNRSRKIRISRGPIPLQHLHKNVSLSFTQADAKTGSFGIKIHTFN